MEEKSKQYRVHGTPVQTMRTRGTNYPETTGLKLLWLAMCDIEDTRARQRAKDKGKAAAERKGAGRLIEGQVTTNWKQALAQLAAAYPDRMNPYL